MSGYLPNLVEFSIAFLLHFLALIRIGLIFWYKIKSQKEIAPFLIALLLNWTVVCVLIIPYELYGIAVWRPIDELYHNGQVLFFMALPCHIFLAMIPVSVFFLTLDRILIIRFAYNYGQRAKRIVMYGYVLILFLCFIVCMFAFLSALPVEKETKCEIYGCILGESVEIYLGWRAFCSIFNFTSGIAFFIILYKSSQKLAIQQQAFAGTENNKEWKKQQSKNNKMTVLAIINEFFLSFLPHFGPFIWEKINGPGSSMGTGPLSEIMSSVEVLIFASVYSQVLKSNAQNSSILSGAGAASHNRMANHRPSRIASSNVAQIISTSRASQSHPNFRQNY